MTEVQSAVGRVGLRRLPEWLRLRARNAAVLTAAFSRIAALRVPAVPAGAGPAWYKYYAYVRPERLRDGWSRDRIMAEVSAEGAVCLSGSCSEVYLEKAFDSTGMRPVGRLPAARELGETSLMFLVHPTLAEADLERTAQAVARVFERASR
jgi:dTDP-4-amino-4,6-dideoxygalactose transaminase